MTCICLPSFNMYLLLAQIKQQQQHKCALWLRSPHEQHVLFVLLHPGDHRRLRFRNAKSNVNETAVVVFDETLPINL
jgi:hypothetical protein